MDMAGRDQDCFLNLWFEDKCIGEHGEHLGARGLIRMGGVFGEGLGEELGVRRKRFAGR